MCRSKKRGHPGLKDLRLVLTRKRERFIHACSLIHHIHDSLYREGTTTRSSTIRGQSASRSTHQRTLPGSVGSSFLMLRQTNPDVLAAETPIPQPFFNYYESRLWVSAGRTTSKTAQAGHELLTVNTTDYLYIINRITVKNKKGALT